MVRLSGFELSFLLVIMPFSLVKIWGIGERGCPTAAQDQPREEKSMLANLPEISGFPLHRRRVWMDKAQGLELAHVMATGVAS